MIIILESFIKPPDMKQSRNFASFSILTDCYISGFSYSL